MSKLPDSWTACLLGDVVSYGVTQKVEPGISLRMLGFLNLKISKRVLQKFFKRSHLRSVNPRVQKITLLPEMSFTESLDPT
ncbi:hypothetical protein A6070_12415 [Syntrophotalea acetylenica]|nr:hypothetical protein A6070_12415 [Syntrophotalea acetylenica]